MVELVQAKSVPKTYSQGGERRRARARVQLVGAWLLALTAAVALYARNGNFPIGGPAWPCPRRKGKIPSRYQQDMHYQERVDPVKDED